ncbi:MAG: DsbA family protein [Sphingomonadales bacterium]|nr:DsbA family protein [Sphingomonadales bacterium]
MVPRRVAIRPGLGWLVVSAVAILGAALFVFADLGTLRPSHMANAQSKMPKDEFERRVRAYLLEHPEVIAEALQRLELRERAAQVSAAKSILKTRADELLRDPASPVGGNPQGDVTLVEFFDYNCPYCRQVAPHMEKAEASDPKLRIVYKEFPILGANSTFAAKAALAAHRQGKYAALHKALMETKGTVGEKTVLDAAGRLGLDVERLKADMADPAIQAHIDRNLALARALQINGTPAFVIGEQIVPGAVDLATLERLIRETRKKK